MNIALIFAGGAGKRMHTRGLPKQFLEFRGKPIIIYTLELFERHPQIDGMVVACIEDRISELNRYIERFNLKKVNAVIPGGKTGQDSIRLGLVKVSEFAPDDSVVLIHDGVRPLIDADTITRNIENVREYGSCITCVPAMETVLVDRKSAGDADDFYIPHRNDTLIARAPQSFYLKDILEAQLRAEKEGRNDFIDCCSMMNFYGYHLRTIEGPIENIKITTPTDFFVFKTLVDINENKQIFGF